MRRFCAETGAPPFSISAIAKTAAGIARCNIRAELWKGSNRIRFAARDCVYMRWVSFGRKEFASPGRRLIQRAVSCHAGSAPVKEITRRMRHNVMLESPRVDRQAVCKLMSRLCSSRFERAARKLGWTRIAGIDEAGRGALFGPVLAAAVILNPKRRIVG